MATPFSVSRLLQGACAALVFGSGGFALAGEAGGGATPAGPVDPIAALIGDAECDDAGQCRAVGIGAKPCGGPGGYLPWSTRQTDPSALQAAVEAQARAQKEDAKSRGLVSDCRWTPEPTAACRPRASDGRRTCQLVPGVARSAR